MNPQPRALVWQPTGARIRGDRGIVQLGHVLAARRHGLRVAMVGRETWDHHKTDSVQRGPWIDGDAMQGENLPSNVVRYSIVITGVSRG